LKDGKRHGEWKSYYENSKLREEGNYENGLEKGIFKYYDENEKINRTEHCFIRDSFIVDF
jgi:antitoxin component YwqK of YwqJK toxin-antitoxin module